MAPPPAHPFLHPPIPRSYAHTYCHHRRQGSCQRRTGVFVVRVFGYRTCGPGRVRRELEEGINEWPIPSLVIQPLVENAVKHDLAGMEDGGTVTVRISQKHELLHISVEDDGIGMPQEHLDELVAGECLHPENNGNGIGVRNCNNRLKQLYGQENQLTIKSRPGQGTRISFAIPRPMVIQ